MDTHKISASPNTTFSEVFADAKARLKNYRATGVSVDTLEIDFNTVPVIVRAQTQAEEAWRQYHYLLSAKFYGTTKR